MSLTHSRLSGMLQGSRNDLESCAKLLLLWLAASDGQIDETEEEFASERFPDVDDTVPAADLLALIRDGDRNSLEMAIRTLAAESREIRTGFLDLAITLSMADHEMANNENLILRFFADALYLGTAVLEKRFQTLTGKPLPEPGDPADAGWWRRVAGEAQGHEGKVEIRARYGSGGELVGAAMTRETALEILGLDAGASQDEIERAYRSRKAALHGDRLEELGETVRSQIIKNLNKIEKAFDILKV